MELRDGFIVDVFVYCDGWCATCAVTNQCLAFNDADLWRERHLEMMRARSALITTARRKLHDQAFAYRTALREWLRGNTTRRSVEFDREIEGLLWNASVIASRTSRALGERSRRNPIDGHPDGLAKVALVGIDRSVAAWDALTTHQLVSADTARRFSSELCRLARAIQLAFPHARQFVRPGFDEGAAPSAASRASRTCAACD